MAAAPRKVRGTVGSTRASVGGPRDIPPNETHAPRGGDAAHLASAAAIADDRTVMVTADRHLRTAARDLGLAAATPPG